MSYLNVRLGLTDTLFRTLFFFFHLQWFFHAEKSLSNVLAISLNVDIFQRNWLTKGLPTISGLSIHSCCHQSFGSVRFLVDEWEQRVGRPSTFFSLHILLYKYINLIGKLTNVIPFDILQDCLFLCQSSRNHFYVHLFCSIFLAMKVFLSLLVFVNVGAIDQVFLFVFHFVASQGLHWNTVLLRVHRNLLVFLQQTVCFFFLLHSILG